ncbi:MAG TPA: hypothetical protein VIN08_27100, partial [Ohtaekwangia sp.]|uniref:hypothetical protein n=1 Tax=Ohtaekwangia sp. TaxID=2066019 RepID=UPI002F94D476
VPLDAPGKSELLVNVEKLFTADPENKNGEAVHDYSMRYFFGNAIAARKNDLTAKKKIVFRGRALNDAPCQLQIALVQKDGSAYGAVITVGLSADEYILDLQKLQPVKLVTLPRPYPSFLPYFFKPSGTQPFSITTCETLQISIGPGIPADQLSGKHGIAIESIRLE